jgi:hypothetical protein
MEPKEPKHYFKYPIPPNSLEDYNVNQLTKNALHLLVIWPLQKFFSQLLMSDKKIVQTCLPILNSGTVTEFSLVLNVHNFFLNLVYAWMWLSFLSVHIKTLQITKFS